MQASVEPPSPRALSATRHRWVTRGDLDGFFGLAIDNLVQLLLIDHLGRHVLGFSQELLQKTVLPGVAISLAVGNVFYAVQARRLAAAEKRNDVCALPYGINTVSLFAYVFLVMLPVKLAATAQGHPDPARAAWQAGLWACLGSGIIEFLGSFVAERIRRATPRAALLSTLAGIALGFISLGFLFRTFARPVVGLVTLGVVLLTYFGRVRFRGGLPGGFVAVLLGVLLGWAQGFVPTGAFPASVVEPALPRLFVGDLWAGITDAGALSHLSIIVPMGLFNLIGSLQNIESAEAAGDRYPTQSSLAVNGLGTVAAALCGSCFPTTIYIGHPGWKAMGARAGYSLLNAGFFLVVLLLGLLPLITWAVPVEAGMAIVLWIGIVITAQAFEKTPRRHAPAVVMGLLPGVAAWGALLAKNGVRTATDEATPLFGPHLVDRFLASDTWIEGAFALEQGFIFSAMILAAVTTALIERQFLRAAVWCLLGAALSLTGLMHSYAYTPMDTALSLRPAWGFVLGYAALGVLFLAARWITTPLDDGTALNDDTAPDANRPYVKSSP